jgi:hypothetical protein
VTAGRRQGGCTICLAPARWRRDMSHGGRTASPIRAHEGRLGHVGKSARRSGREGGMCDRCRWASRNAPRHVHRRERHASGRGVGVSPRSDMPAGSGNDVIEMSGKGWRCRIGGSGAGREGGRRRCSRCSDAPLRRMRSGRKRSAVIGAVARAGPPGQRGEDFWFLSWHASPVFRVSPVSWRKGCR